MPIAIRKGAAEKPTTGQRHGDQLYIGVVESSTGTSPGPASGLSYSVLINTDGGTVRLDPVSPVVPRWPDTVDVVALQEGQPVIVGRTRTTYYLLTAEMPSLEECVPAEEPEEE